MISQYFQSIASTPITLYDFLLNLLVACLCGLIHVTVYRLSYRGAGYSLSMVNALVMIAVITSLTIMVIGDSLARAFGLVGAMSIIRFRTAIKDVMDVVHIFLALAIGMTAGVGLRSAAFLSTIAISVLYMLLIQFNLVSTVRGQYILQFVLSNDDESKNNDPVYNKTIREYSADYRLLNVKSISEESMEISYLVKPKAEIKITELTKALKKHSSIRSVYIFSDEEQF